MQGVHDWYKHLHKPEWIPKGSLIESIWSFIYVVTALAVLWYWNVPIFTWVHYLVAVILMVNAYMNATWNRIFFVDHDIPKALQWMKRMNATTVIATIIMAIFSPIGAVLMLPYIAWVYIYTNMIKDILEANKKAS